MKAICTLALTAPTEAAEVRLKISRKIGSQSDDVLETLAGWRCEGVGIKKLTVPHTRADGVEVVYEPSARECHRYASTLHHRYLPAVGSDAHLYPLIFCEGPFCEL